jgi:hypothetical protein
MKHLEKFPIIFGGDLISMNICLVYKKEGLQGFGGLGALKEIS